MCVRTGTLGHRGPSGRRDLRLCTRLLSSPMPYHTVPGCLSPGPLVVGESQRAVCERSRHPLLPPALTMAPGVERVVLLMCQGWL